MNDRIIIDGAVYERIQETTDKKMSLQEYCKKNKLWAAMDKDNRYYTYKNKPYLYQSVCWKNLCSNFKCYISPLFLSIPKDIPYDKSLIAPDGSMPLLYNNSEKKQDTKENIQDYCRKNRKWAAKNSNEEWFIFKYKPNLYDYKNWLIDDLCDLSFIDTKDMLVPAVPYNVSLIAPDGSMPLWKPRKKEPKKPKIGKWYKVEKRPELGIGKIVEKDKNLNLYLFYSPHNSSGHNGEDFIDAGKYTGNHCFWVLAANLIEVPAPTVKKWHPKRFEPIFVWNDSMDERMSLPVLYYWGKIKNSTYSIQTCNILEFNDSGNLWQHMKKFDASLVGIPRKDWPKDEQGNFIDAY